MGIPKSISQLLSPSSACDSPSSFSSLPWLSSQNAHGSHLKRSQLKSLQKSRLKSRQKSQQKSRERNRGRSRPNQESQQANRSLQLSTMQVDGSTYWWHLLVESGQQGLCYLQERWHAVRISYSEQMLQKTSHSGLPRN